MMLFYTLVVLVAGSTWFAGTSAQVLSPCCCDDYCCPDPSTVECFCPIQECPAIDICYRERPSAPGFTVVPIPLKEIVAHSVFFVSAVSNISFTENWDGATFSFFKITDTLYIEFFTVTYIDGSLKVYVSIPSDECGNPGTYVVSQNTVDGDPAVYYDSIIAEKKVGQNQFYSLNKYASLSECSLVNSGSDFILDLASVYPTKLSRKTRTKAAEDLRAQMSPPPKSGFNLLPYKNKAACVSSYNNFPCINAYKAQQTNQIYWPLNC